MKTKDEIQLAVIGEQVTTIRTDVKKIKEKLEKQYVTKDEFDPIKKIVYGIVSIALLGVIGALIKLVIIP